MAKDKVKDSIKESNQQGVAESSKKVSKNPISKVAGSSKESNSTPLTNANFEKMSGSTLEELTLAEGRQSYDSSITVIDGINHINLPIINVAANATPEESRDGGRILRKFSSYSKIYKAKVANVVPGGYSGISSTLKTPMREAQSRARGNLFREFGGPADFVFPDAVNFGLNLNISGHLPRGDRTKVRQWQEHSVNGLQPLSWDPAADSALYMVTTPQAAEITADTTAELTAKKVLLTGSGQSHTPKVHKYTVPLNKAALNTNHNDAFNMDIDTHNYFTDMSKIIRNLSELTESKLDNIPSILKTEDFIYSKMMNDIDFATFLYILIDSWKCNLDYINLIGDKLGIVDSTIRSIFIGSNADRQLFLSRLSSLMAVFDYIPVNSKVIEEWDRIKYASITGKSDPYAEGSMLVIPHFKLLFADLRNVTDLQYSHVSANASTTSVRVPLDNLLRYLVHEKSNVIYPGKPVANNDTRWFGKAGVRHEAYSNMNASEDNHSNALHLTLSAVRMSVDSANLMKSMMRETFWNIIPSYFVRNNRYYSLINSSGAFEGTNFKFLKPSMIDFKTVGEHKLNNFNVHMPYLVANNPHLDGLDTLPVIETEKVTNDTTFANAVQHHIIYDKYNNKAFVQKYIKGFVVSNCTPENENESNGNVDNDVNAELLSINVSSSIVIPFMHSHTFHFSMNITPVVHASVLRFTHLKNKDYYDTPMLFEFICWNSDKVYERNSDLRLPHVSGLRPETCEYFVSQTFGMFAFKCNRMAHRDAIYSLGIPIPKNQFSSNDVLKTVTLDGVLGYSNPETDCYHAFWTYQPFAGASSEEILSFSGNYLSYADLLIRKM